MSLMNRVMMLNTLVLVASLLLNAFPVSGTTSDSSLTLTATVPGYISITVVKPQEKVGFGDIKYSDLPVTLTSSDDIIVRANVNWILYIWANYDYMKSTKGNDYLINQMTAQVVEPVTPDPIVATVAKGPYTEKLFEGAAGEHNLKIEFSQLFTKEDKPGSYRIIVVYQGTPAD
jgi:hypothetical protein